MDVTLWYILTGNQRIRPGLSDLRGPRGGLFCHGLRKEEQQRRVQNVAVGFGFCI